MQNTAVSWSMLHKNSRICVRFRTTKYICILVRFTCAGGSGGSCAIKSRLATAPSQWASALAAPVCRKSFLDWEKRPYLHRKASEIRLCFRKSSLLYYFERLRSLLQRSFHFLKALKQHGSRSRNHSIGFEIYQRKKNCSATFGRFSAD